MRKNCSHFSRSFNQNPLVHGEMKFSSLDIFKMTGAGNDFLIIDSALPHGPSRSEMAKSLCDRHYGIGADGLVILKKNHHGHFRWDFYNSDGSKAEMCGNAARCVIRFLSDQTKTSGLIKVHTQDGHFEGECLPNGQVAVLVTPPKHMEFAISLNVDSEIVIGDQIWAGVPHFILRREPDKELAKKVRRHAHFESHGTNVTFLSESDDQHIQAVTFERGVEDFTLACGTGAIAAGLSQFHLRPGISSASVQMPGGVLTIEKGPPLKQIGPAEWIAKINWRQP